METEDTVLLLLYGGWREVPLDQLLVFECDETPTNTVWTNGIIQRIELNCSKAVAMSYFFSLALKPLKHLLEELDGSTTHLSAHLESVLKHVKRCKLHTLTALYVMLILWMVRKNRNIC